MARYYESESLIDFVKQNTPHINGETTMECVERAIREAPTADVVPKSEVARLQEDVDRLQEINNRQVENIKLAKGEVAREIFEEIEEMLISSSLLLDCTMLIDAEMLAELKKKYQGGE